MEAFSGENVVAIENLEESGHTTHLLLDVLLQILLFHQTRRHFELLASLTHSHTAQHRLHTEINVTFGI